ncbi:glycoside hydrolase family 19 protein [Lysobacter brunescens]|uniref:Glycoside hydrolase family 19 protein n=1 Tax=Lysobacter brunescens TaxID=262323 RepID=A0ABW2YE15_9GAMM
MPTQNEIDMLRAARAAGITSREEMANFMGQMGHESQGFTRLEESFRYTQGIQQIPVESAMREGAEALEAARLEALQGRPQELARLMYGGRMGNDDVADGYLYRGRGYTQLTGESNYRDAGRALDLDLVGNPALAADRGNSQRIAIWYWQDRVPVADRDDVSRATRAINGGDNGLEDRHNRYDAWHAVLTPEFVADLDAGRVQAGRGVAPAIGRPAMEDDALRRLERGAEVRELVGDLRTLNVRDDRNRAIPDGQIFTERVEQGVRRFQQGHDLPVTGRADPATLEAIERAVQQRPQEPAPAAEGPRAPGPVVPPRQGAAMEALPLNDPGHPNHDTYSFFLDLTRERCTAMGIAPSAKDEVLAAGLTSVAFDRGLVNGVGFARFSADGTQVAMSDTKDPSAEWARTGVGKVGELLQQSIDDSSRIVADVNQALAQQQALAQTQSRAETQEGPVIRGPSMA